MNKRATTRPSLESLVLIALFLVFIYVPFVGSLFGVDVASQLIENRQLAERPGLTFTKTSIETFPSRFEAFFNDHFGFRKALIRTNNVLHVRLLGVSPSDRVDLGKDGWLFLPVTSTYYRNAHPFSAEDLEAWKQSLEERRDWLAGRGIRYLFVVVPNKNTIYPDFMPEALTKVHPASRLDQLMAYLAAHSDVEILDLRQALLEQRAQTMLYHRTGTHWTDEGAYIGYQTIIEYLSRWFPTGSPLGKETLRRRPFDDYPGADLARVLGLQDVLREDRLLLSVPETVTTVSHEEILASNRGDYREIAVTESKQPNLPSAVIFRDSFTTALKPFLSEHFSRAVYVWYRGPSTQFTPSIVLEEQPNVVLQIVTERGLLVWPPPSNTMEPGGQTDEN